MAIPKDFHQMMADKMSGGPDDGAPDDDSDPGYDDGLKDAMSQFIEAVHSKDVDTAADAFETAMTLCQKKGPAKPGDDGDGAPGHSALLLIPHGKH